MADDTARSGGGAGGTGGQEPAWRRAGSKPKAQGTPPGTPPPSEATGAFDATMIPGGAAPVDPTDDARDDDSPFDATMIAGGSMPISSDDEASVDDAAVGEGTSVQAPRGPSHFATDRPPDSHLAADRTMVHATPAPVAGAMPATAEPLGGMPEIQGIDIVREIARGGMGVVFEGHQGYLDRRVAVKLLHHDAQGGDFTRRFQREAKILASLTHPNVVSCYQAGVAPDGRCFLVMEFIDGPTLAGWVDKHGPLDAPHALRACRAVASALAYAHKSGVIHRDVKPANVLLKTPLHAAPGDPFPFEPMLADLGLARASGDVSPKVIVEGLTMQGTVMGSPPTMAPEQFDAPDSVDFRTDIYGLGCVLFQALTGRLAFPQSTLTKLIASKSATPPPDPRELAKSVPIEVGQLVRDMLACKPEQRPASYDELLARFDRLLDKGRHVVAKSRRVPLVAAAVVAIGALGLAANAFLGGYGGADTDQPDGDTGSRSNVDVAHIDPAIDETNARDGQGSSSTGGASIGGASTSDDAARDVKLGVQPVVPVVDDTPRLVLPAAAPIAVGEEWALLDGEAVGGPIVGWLTPIGLPEFWSERGDAVNGALGEAYDGRASITCALPAPSWTLTGFIELVRPTATVTAEASVVLVLGAENGIEFRQSIDESNVVVSAAIVRRTSEGVWESETPLPELTLSPIPRADYKKKGALAFRFDWDGTALVAGWSFDQDPEDSEVLVSQFEHRAEWTTEQLIPLGAPARLCIELDRGLAKLGRFTVRGV